jgi:hypothetical protein
LENVKSPKPEVMNKIKEPIQSTNQKTHLEAYGYLSNLSSNPWVL